MATVTERINVQVREDGSRVVERRIAGIGEAAEKAADPVSRLKGLLAGIITGAAVMQIARMADEYTNLQNKLRLVTTSTENLARVTKELTGIANSTRSDLAGTVQIYTRLAASQDELGVSQKQLLGFTKSLNQAIILSGANAQEAQAGLIQLSQGMASGTLRGDELRSVLEQLPAVADVIAKGLGVTRGELRLLGQEGKITAKQIIDAFAEASDDLNKKFGTTVPTMGQALTVLKNQFLTFIGQLDQTYGISSKVAEAILFISNNLQTIIPIITAAGIALAALFAPNVIIAFTTQIKALWALLLANPFVALAAAIAGVLSYLYLMRDEISLGIDETTTLGDLMRSVWEGISGVIGDVWAVVKVFFTDIVFWAHDAFTDIESSGEQAAESQESAWLSVLRTVVQVFDMIGGTIRGTMAGVQAVVLKVIAALMNNFQQLGNAIQGAMNLDGAAVLDAVKSNLNGWKDAGTDLGGTFGEAFAKEQLRQADSGLEALLNDRIKRAQEIAKERLAANKPEGGLNPANPSGGTKPPIDADAAKKAARELEKLKNALANVLDQADPVAAATRQLAEAQDILTRSVKAGLITQEQANKAYEQIKYVLRDQLDPLAALNREIDENIGLLKLSNQEREIEGQMLDLTARLRRDGIVLTTEETNALRAKLVVEQELNRIAQARDSIQANSPGQQLKDFQDQVTAMKELLALGREGGGLGEADTMGQLEQMLPWANLENTQEQMASYVQIHADMYAQIAALEDAGVIKHQTAEMLKAQADQQYQAQRLAYTKNFFGLLAGLSSSSNKKLAAIGKAAAIVQATIDGVLAVQKTMAETPYPYNIPLAAAQAVLAASNVAQIASQNTAGFRTGGEFTVGGHGGADSQMVSLRATPGEKININTPAQARALEKGGDQAPNVEVPVTIAVVKSPDEIPNAIRGNRAVKTAIVDLMAEDPAQFRQVLNI